MISAHARDLRRNQTDAEALLWSKLRSNRMSVKFRRQQPMPPYIVDFFCAEARLIIELDGGQHTEDKDRARSEFLSSSGNKLIRFWNNDVIENIDGVLQTINAALKAQHDPR